MGVTKITKQMLQIIYILFDCEEVKQIYLHTNFLLKKLTNRFWITQEANLYAEFLPIFAAFTCHLSTGSPLLIAAVATISRLRGTQSYQAFLASSFWRFL